MSTPSDTIAQVERRAREETLESDLRDYITNDLHHYSSGGVVNLLTTIAQICTEQSQNFGDDWQAAGEHITACSVACDLEYKVTP